MDKFIERIQLEYNNEYDLSRIDFKGSKHPIDVICPVHGLFSITPDNLIYNRGCPSCRGVHPRGYPARLGKGDTPKKTPGRKPYLEYHRFYIHKSDGDFLKFGITSGDVECRRIAVENLSDFKFETVFIRTFYDRRLCAAVERTIKLAFKTGVVSSGSMCEGLTETVALRHLDQIIDIVCSFPSSKNPPAPDVPVMIKR